MKEKWEDPSIVAIHLDFSDVITTSGGCDEDYPCSCEFAMK